MEASSIIMMLLAFLGMSTFLPMFFGGGFDEESDFDDDDFNDDSIFDIF